MSVSIGFKMNPVFMSSVDFSEVNGFVDHFKQWFRTSRHDVGRDDDNAACRGDMGEEIYSAACCHDLEEKFVCFLTLELTSASCRCDFQECFSSFLAIRKRSQVHQADPAP